MNTQTSVIGKYFYTEVSGWGIVKVRIESEKNGVYKVHIPCTGLDGFRAKSEVFTNIAKAKKYFK